MAFTPASEDMATDIRATGVSCRFARDFIRDSYGWPDERFRRFRCTRRAEEPTDSLPYTQFSCTRRGEEPKSISWRRY